MSELGASLRLLAAVVLLAGRETAIGGREEEERAERQTMGLCFEAWMYCFAGTRWNGQNDRGCGLDWLLG